MYIDLINPTVTLDQATGDIVNSLENYDRRHIDLEVEKACGEEERVVVFLDSKTIVFREHFGNKDILLTAHQNVIDLLNNCGVKFTTPVDKEAVE